MRIRSTSRVTVHRSTDPRRPIELKFAGLLAQMTRTEARQLADAIHDTADQETTND